MKKVIAILVVVFSLIGINYAKENDSKVSENTPSVSEPKLDSLDSPADLSDAMEAQGKIMEKHGKVMEKFGKEMEKLGKQMERVRRDDDREEISRQMEKWGDKMDSLGKIMEKHGKVMEKLGSKMEVAHQKMNNWLFNELKKEGLISSLDGKVSVMLDGNSMIVNGKTVSESVVQKLKKDLAKYWGRELKHDATLYIKGRLSQKENGDVEIDGNHSMNF